MMCDEVMGIREYIAEREVVTFFDDAIKQQQYGLDDDRIVEVLVGDQFIGLSSQEFHALVNALHRQLGDRIVSHSNGAGWKNVSWLQK